MERGEVRGTGVASDIGCPRGIHSNGTCGVNTAASAQVGRKSQRTGGVQLGDEPLVPTGGVGALEGIEDGEISRAGQAGDVSIAGKIDRDRPTKGIARATWPDELIAAAAEVSRIYQAAQGGEFGHEHVLPRGAPVVG